MVNSLYMIIVDVGNNECCHSKGALFNMCDYDGRTPLHVACSNGNVDVVRFLLEEGAPVHQKDRFNYSPLDNALQFKQTEVVPLLTQTGAHVSIMTPKHVNTLIALELVILYLILCLDFKGILLLGERR